MKYADFIPQIRKVSNEARIKELDHLENSLFRVKSDVVVVKKTKEFEDFIEALAVEMFENEKTRKGRSLETIQEQCRFSQPVEQAVFKALGTSHPMNVVYDPIACAYDVKCPITGILLEVKSTRRSFRFSMQSKIVSDWHVGHFKGSKKSDYTVQGILLNVPDKENWFVQFARIIDTEYLLKYMYPSLRDDRNSKESYMEFPDQGEGRVANRLRNPLYMRTNFPVVKGETECQINLEKLLQKM